MNTRILAMGDMLVEIMREEVGVSLKEKGRFLGPYPSGAPVIFAGCLANLGLDTSFVGSVGGDEFGEAILERLDRDGVDTDKVQVLEDETTGVAFVTYFADGDRKFIFHAKNAAAGRVDKNAIREDYLSGFDHLHVMGTSLAINENWRRATVSAASIVKENGGTISFDPNLRPEMLKVSELRDACDKVLNLTDIFLPGEEELIIFGDSKDPEKTARKLVKNGIEMVGLKMGERGSKFITDSIQIHRPSYPVKEVDPTGAGDCFDAGVIKGYYEGWELEKIADFANAVGAIAVTEKGPMEGIAKLDEIIDFIEDRSEKFEGEESLFNP